SKEQLAQNNYDLRKVIPVGTGPFRYKEHKEAEYWLFEANRDYWDKELPYVDAVRNIHVASWTDRGTAVLTGQADLSWNVSRDTFEEGAKRSNMKTALLANFGSYMVVWNDEKPPFNDVRVRRALFLAINRHDEKKMYREEYFNVSRWQSPAGEGATPYEELIKLPGYRQDNSADIVEAKRLLAEAGYPEGKGLRTLDFLCPSVVGLSQVYCPFYADQLKRNLGINVNMRVVERAMVSEELKKDFDIAQGTIYHSPIRNHTPQWMIVYYSGGSQNFERYKNPEFDAIVDQLNGEMDTAKRALLFRKAEEILDANPPLYVSGFTSHMAMWASYVKGMALETRVQTEWGRTDTAWLDK
ncbi:MAG: ABC transporter substrate-binding protein, partial [Chloroflexota bacterium]|nr:ABC transporter substrate-binding protein [Chloroflexota bacterium]